MGREERFVIRQADHPLLEIINLFIKEFFHILPDFYFERKERKAKREFSFPLRAVIVFENFG
jgi:hypothetical protein